MSIGRTSCQAGLVTYPDGTTGILVAGGFYDSSAEFLDIDRMQIWEPRASLPTYIAAGASVPYQDSFLIVGGWDNGGIDTIYYYNPAIDNWDLLDNLDDSRDGMAAFMVPDEYANCS